MAKINWIEINCINDIPKSNNNYIVIFKHSPRCIVSKIVFKRFELEFTDNLSIQKYIYIDVITMKKLSNDISVKYNVYHESPQLLLIKEDEVLYHSSHSDIKFSNLNDYLN
jgi:bacillithiol system protein YtxJ